MKKSILLLFIALMACQSEYDIAINEFSIPDYQIIGVNYELQRIVGTGFDPGIKNVQFTDQETSYWMTGSATNGSEHTVIYKNSGDFEDFVELLSIANEEPRRLDFLNSKTGILWTAKETSSYQVLRLTVDGGLNWDAIYDQQSGFSDISFPTENQIVILSANKLIVTESQGDDWREITIPVADGQYIDKVFCLPGNHFLLQSDYDLYIFKESTNVLEPVEIPNVSSRVRTIQFINESVGYLTINKDHRLLKTLDGGYSWEIVSSVKAFQN